VSNYSKTLKTDVYRLEDGDVKLTATINPFNDKIHFDFDGDDFTNEMSLDELRAIAIVALASRSIHIDDIYTEAQKFKQ